MLDSVRRLARYGIVVVSLIVVPAFGGMLESDPEVLLKNLKKYQTDAIVKALTKKQMGLASETLRYMYLLLLLGDCNNTGCDYSHERGINVVLQKLENCKNDWNACEPRNEAQEMEFGPLTSAVSKASIKLWEVKGRIGLNDLFFEGIGSEYSTAYAGSNANMRTLERRKRAENKTLKPQLPELERSLSDATVKIELARKKFQETVDADYILVAEWKSTTGTDLMYNATQIAIQELNKHTELDPMTLKKIRIALLCNQAKWLDPTLENCSP